MQHFDQLSPCCQHYVRQTAPDVQTPHHHDRPHAALAEPQPPRPSAGHVHKASHPATVVGVSGPLWRAVEVVPTVEAPPAVDPLHRLACFFIFTALLLSSFLLTRAVLMALCAKRPAKNIPLIPVQAAQTISKSRVPPTIKV